MDLKTVTLQLSLLADSLIHNCLTAAAEESQSDLSDFCVLAFGKLGGEELNYSSDIDLVFVCSTAAERYWALAQHVIRALTEPTSAGFLYRVDMRLRPWGSSRAAGVDRRCVRRLPAATWPAVGKASSPESATGRRQSRHRRRNCFVEPSRSCFGASAEAARIEIRDMKAAPGVPGPAGTVATGAM